jgi:dUTP pyrophosphatase
MAVPLGYEIQIRPRSGLSYKTHLDIPNAPGTVDSHFRGEVKVIMFNIGKDPIVIEKGQRIAQMVINKVELWKPTIVDSLPETVRGEGGFGSSGV